MEKKISLWFKKEISERSLTHEVPVVINELKKRHLFGNTLGIVYKFHF